MHGFQGRHRIYFEEVKTIRANCSHRVVKRPRKNPSCGSIRSHIQSLDIPDKSPPDKSDQDTVNPYTDNSSLENGCANCKRLTELVELVFGTPFLPISKFVY